MTAELGWVMVVLLPLIAAGAAIEMPARFARPMAIGIAMVYSLGAFLLPNVHRLPVVAGFRVGAIDVGLVLSFDLASAALIALFAGATAAIQIADPSGSESGRLALLGSGVLLALGGSPVTLFLGWQAVGVAVAFLVGRIDPRVGQETFIVSRIGDLGFLLALVLLLQPTPATTAAGVLLVLPLLWSGAQLPLSGWLRRLADRDPPTLALVATTVPAAGIFLWGRFDVRPLAESVAAGLGALTACVSASAGTVAKDMSRVAAATLISAIGLVLLTAAPFGWALTFTAAHGLLILIANRGETVRGPGLVILVLGLSLLPFFLPAPPTRLAIAAWLVGSTLNAVALALGVWRTLRPGRLPAANPWLRERLGNHWHLDSLIDVTVVQPVGWLSRTVVYRTVDQTIVDGTVSAIGRLGAGLGFIPQLFHSGNIQRYLGIFVIGVAVLLLGWFLPSGDVASKPPAVEESVP